MAPSRRRLIDLHTRRKLDASAQSLHLGRHEGDHQQADQRDRSFRVRSVEDRDGMLQSGMEEGAKESMDRLDELLAALK